MVVTNESKENVLESLLQRQQQEHNALGSDAATVLAKLSISVDNLPQKQQQLLREASTAQLRAGVEDAEVTGLMICQGAEQVIQMEEEYEILLLKQKNKELQAKIDRNSLEIEQLKQELSQSRTRLNQKTPNPDNVGQYCRQMAAKLAQYQDSYHRAQAKYSSLSVPGAALPGALVSQAGGMAALRAEAAALARRAEDVQLARTAREQLRQLRK